MNEYLKNLNKIEFVVTYACTGRCKHCSVGEHRSCESIDPEKSADAVRKISSSYDIKTVMAFGGEPLLCMDAVLAIMSAAREVGVPKRQIITNGFFSASHEKIRSVAESLFRVGVNDLLVSVDAFHQESIPLDTVRAFLNEANRLGIPTRIQPAWLVSREDENPYNERTRQLLESLSELGIPESEGNVVFPEGNAKLYLSEYFKDGSPENPYEENPYDVRCVSFSPDGEVLGGNFYETDIAELLSDYAP